MSIDILAICFGIAYRQIDPYFTLRTITRVNLIGFSPNLTCALILLRSALGLLIGKFRQFLTASSAGGMIMMGFYSFKFYLIKTEVEI